MSLGLVEAVNGFINLLDSHFTKDDFEIVINNFQKSTSKTKLGELEVSFSSAEPLKTLPLERMRIETLPITLKYIHPTLEYIEILYSGYLVNKFLSHITSYNYESSLEGDAQFTSTITWEFPPNKDVQALNRDDKDRLSHILTIECKLIYFVSVLMDLNTPQHITSYGISSN